MADKYLIVGAAFYGDGTSSAEATSNGGVGAWNTINVMLGTAPTYGTLVNGDTIYVRSKTSAGADVVTNIGGTFTVGPASGITGTTWIIDNGTTWSGINGSVKFVQAATQEFIFLRALNTFLALMPSGLALQGRGNYIYPINAISVYAKNVEFIYSTQAIGATLATVNTSGSTLDDCIFTFGAFPCSISIGAGYKATLINPTINLISTTGLSQATGVFQSASGASLEVYGGKVSGAGAISSQALFYAGTAGAEAPEYMAVGLYAPIEMPLVTTGAEGSAMFNLRMLAADKKASASIGGSWGYADSRNDGYYPTLSATLPDSTNATWSWKLKANYANAYRPAKLVMSKMFTGTAAVKTLTLEMLVSTSVSASVDKSNVYMRVQYIDATTGNLVSQTSKATGALDASTANWSATTYGAASFDKKSLSLTTSSSIKQDTLVTAVLFVAYAASLANDMYFVDPDPSLT